MVFTNQHTFSIYNISTSPFLPCFIFSNVDPNLAFTHPHSQRKGKETGKHHDRARKHHHGYEIDGFRPVWVDGRVDVNEQSLNYGARQAVRGSKR